MLQRHINLLCVGIGACVVITWLVVQSEPTTTDNDNASNPITYAKFERKTYTGSHSSPITTQVPHINHLQWETTTCSSLPEGFRSVRRFSKDELLGLVHIPKTAATSLASDMHKRLPNIWKRVICNKQPGCERCYHHNGFKNRTKLVILREPHAQVYSQFLECKYDPYFIQTRNGFSFPGESNVTIPYEGIQAWLDQFDEHFNISDGDFNCYTPINMQSRYLTCDRESGHHVTHTSELSRSADLAPIATIWDAGWIGITNRYQESMCVLMVQLGEGLPSWCDCQNPEAWSQFRSAHIRHYSPEYSLVDDLSASQRKQIDEITLTDQVLYAEAARRLRGQVDCLEREHNVTIWCPK